jgi:hypothetical protein
MQNGVARWMELSDYFDVSALSTQGILEAR